jgi:hypothetical protein
MRTQLGARATTAVLGLDVVLVVVGIIGAFTVGGSSTRPARPAGSNAAVAPGGPQAGSDHATTTTTTTAGGRAATSTPATSGRSKGGPATTAAPAPVRAESAPPGPASPPAAGTYTYHLTRSGNSSDTTVKVADDGHAADGVQQVITQNEGSGSISNHVTWRSDGELLRVTDFNSPQSSSACDWQPDIVQVRLPLAVGVSWDVDSSCQTVFAGTPTTAREAFHATVVRYEQLVVGGKAVDCWVISRSDKTTLTSAQYTVEQQGTSTVWWAPSAGLDVRTETKGTTTATSKGQNHTSDTTITEQLASLSPR